MFRVRGFWTLLWDLRRLLLMIIMLWVALAPLILMLCRMSTCSLDCQNVLTDRCLPRHHCRQTEAHAAGSGQRTRGACKAPRFAGAMKRGFSRLAPNGPQRCHSVPEHHGTWRQSSHNVGRWTFWSSTARPVGLGSIGFASV